MSEIYWMQLYIFKYIWWGRNWILNSFFPMETNLNFKIDFQIWALFQYHVHTCASGIGHTSHPIKFRKIWLTLAKIIVNIHTQKQINKQLLLSQSPKSKPCFATKKLWNLSLFFLFTLLVFIMLNHYPPT